MPIGPHEHESGATIMDAKSWLILTLIAVMLLLGGCNAVKGLGKDLHDTTQNVQEWMEGSSRNSRHIQPS